MSIPNSHPSPEKVAFIEQNTKEYFRYTIECYDRARAEGNNVLQWLFAVMTGGLALAGALLKDHQLPLAAAGAATISAAAAFAASELLRGTKSQLTMPPGNYAEPLASSPESDHLMRLNEAKSLDERIKHNLGCVKNLTQAIDLARERMARLPIWFATGIAAAYILNKIFS
jgi:hypothetical protein